MIFGWRFWFRASQNRLHTSRNSPCYSRGNVPKVLVFRRDTHQNNFVRVEKLALFLDQALGTLLSDLSDRGLLEETMVVVATEFGRTPEVNESTGRDHYPQAFSDLIAGGDIQGGRPTEAPTKRARKW